MKIGVFGGTFNPIHCAHLRLACKCREQLGLDTVLIIPTAVPPHKNAPQLASGEDRLAMCRLAVTGESAFVVSDLEIRRTGKSYTAETLRELEALYPGAELYLLMGGDMFLTVQSWKSPEEIYARAVLCALARHRDEYPRLERHKLFLTARGAHCRVLALPPEPMSSTEVRCRISRGEDIRGLVPAAVEDYIIAHGLYAPNGHNC
ncbi:nicotinate-nucleotide adenylyltransferase [Oscillospiraceae bacterium MB08-C2-2]|nr:nicotinate-nucleotide adenylyltransferase [Oscillospiraceae bacterium MB08-C2-2]